MTDIKNLAKIAKACRKAGIKHYKCSDFEFTLSNEEPIKVTRIKGNTEAQADLRPDKIKVEELTDEQLILWSATGGAGIEGVS